MTEQSNLEGVNLEDVVKGMTPQQAMEFLKKQLTPEKAQAFLKEEGVNQLKAAYDAEMAKVSDRLPQYLKLKRMTEIKSKYRKQGLQVY